MQVTTASIFMVLSGVFFLYLYLTKQLTAATAIIVGSMFGIALWRSQTEDNPISLDEAEKKAFTRVRKLQSEGRIPDGTISILPEAELRTFVYVGSNPEFIPYKFDILTQVDAGLSGVFYYLVGVSKYGSILGNTELKRKKSIKETSEEFKEIKAKLEFIKKEPQVERESEDKDVRS